MRCTEWRLLACIGMAVAVSFTGWWSGNIIVGEVSPFLLTSLGTAGTLLLHSGVCVLVFLLVLLLLPETRVNHNYDDS